MTMAYIRLEVPDSRESCAGCAFADFYDGPLCHIYDVEIAWAGTGKDGMDGVPCAACLAARSPAPLPPEVERVLREAREVLPSERHMDERCSCKRCARIAALRRRIDALLAKGG